MLPKINPEKFKSLSEAKTIDHKLFPGKAIEPLLIRLRGVYMDRNGKVLDENQVREYLAELDQELVIKPDSGRQGKGILFLDSNDINLEKLPAETDLVFQEVVSQHASLKEIYPHSVNTFRVFTHLKKGGEIDIKFINLRFGQGGLKVDNVSRGGFWVSIDIDGKTKGPILDEFGIKVGVSHPDTGFNLSNIKISFIDEIIYLCKESHKMFPYVGLIGWDICVDENGHPFILEWNASNPWFWDIEANYGPLFL